MKNRILLGVLLIATIFLWSCNNRFIRIGGKQADDVTSDASINAEYHKKQSEHKAVNEYSAKKKRVNTGSTPLSKKKKAGSSKASERKTPHDKMSGVYTHQGKDHKKFLFFFNRKKSDHAVSASQKLSKEKQKGSPKSKRNRTGKDRLADVYKDRTHKKVLFFFNVKNNKHAVSSSEPTSRAKKKGRALARERGTSRHQISHVYRHVKKQEKKKLLFIFKALHIRDRNKPGYIGDTRGRTSSSAFQKKKNYLKKGGFSFNPFKKRSSRRGVLQSQSQSKASYEFSKRKRKVVLKHHGFLHIFNSKNKKGATASKLKGGHNRGSYEFSKKKHAVVSKRGIFFFGLKDKRMHEASYFSFKERKKKTGKSFSKRKYNYVGKSGLLSMISKGLHSNKTARYGPRGTRGSYQFNSKHKRVRSKKNFLFFFHVKKHEAETSTFSGGKGRKFFSLSFLKNHHKTFRHKRPLFKKRQNNDIGSKRRHEMDLFSPKMRMPK